MPSGFNLVPDPLADALRRGGQTVAPNEDLVVLVGYLGDAPPQLDEEGQSKPMKRIYRDPELNDYIDVPEAAIRWREQVDSPDEFGARSAVWVEREALSVPLPYPEGLAEQLAGAGLGTRLPATLLEAAGDLGMLCRPMTRSRCYP